MNGIVVKPTPGPSIGSQALDSKGMFSLLKLFAAVRSASPALRERGHAGPGASLEAESAPVAPHAARRKGAGAAPHPSLKSPGEGRAALCGIGTGLFAADPSELPSAKRQLWGPSVRTRREACSTSRIVDFCVLSSMPAYLFRMFNMFRRKFSIKISILRH